MRISVGMILSLALVGVSITAAVPGLCAKLSDPDESTCTPLGKETDNDVIASCTRLLRSGKNVGSESAPYLLARGFRYLQQRNYDGAIADLNQAISTWENSEKERGNLGTAYLWRAKAWEQKGNIDRAADDYLASQKYGLSIDLSARFSQKEMKEMGAVTTEIGDEVKLLAAVRSFGKQSGLNELPLDSDSPWPRLYLTPENPVPPISANKERRVALVIGNAAYTGVPKLINPKRDAESVATALRRANFATVTLENDLSRDKLTSALRTFARNSEGADWALVYYAGHGIEMNGANYLIPIDAKLESDRDIQYEAVPLEQVLGAVEGAKSLRIVVLDACRANPFANKMQRTGISRSIGRGLAQIEPDPGTLVVYAARHGQVASDGDGTNSPFAASFIKYITTPGIEIRRLFDFVRDDVMDATAKRQQPFTYGSLPGRQEFYFVGK
jgi:tetratricopeptide (TPR) repeat protein